MTTRDAGRVYTFDALPEKGITFHRNYIRRLVKAGKFPKPLYMSERRPAWTEAMLDEWIAGLGAEAKHAKLAARAKRSRAGRGKRTTP